MLHVEGRAKTTLSAKGGASHLALGNNNGYNNCNKYHLLPEAEYGISAKVHLQGKGNICPFCHILFAYLFRVDHHAPRGPSQSASGIVHVQAWTPPLSGTAHGAECPMRTGKTLLYGWWWSSLCPCAILCFRKWANMGRGNDC